MIISERKYTSDNSDLYVLVHKVFYQNDEYVKFKISLIEKRHNWHFETKTYKVPKIRIQHWKLYEN